MTNESEPSRKIKVPFHPLTAELAKEWYSKGYLTTAGYLVAIKSITRPPGVELRIDNVVAFCKKWEIGRSAFYRAVDALKDEFEWEATHGIVLRERTLSDDLVSFPQRKSVPQAGHLSYERDAKSRKRDSQSRKRDTESRKRDSQSRDQDSRVSKPAQDLASGATQTIQIYSNFIQTLSDGEREIFENFVREEWKKAKGEDVINMERFLAKEADFKSWQQKFLSSPVGKEAKKQAIAAQFDWRNDPRFDDWIWKAFNGGYPWTQENEAEREQRYAFWEWAQDTNAYEGVCYQ